MKRKILALQDIRFEVGEPPSTILHNITLDVFKSDCIMLIGSNGSGKSSLLKTITGLYKPTFGSITLLEASLLEMPIRKRAEFISTMNQDSELSTFSQLTVYENYLIASTKKTKRSRCTKDRTSPLFAADYLMQFNPNLSARLFMPAGKLSGGERQALGLALCLMHEPELIVLDEHTSALDPASSQRLMEITANVVSKTGSTAIICTHNLQDALHYGNRLIAMRKGRIVLDLKEEDKKRISKEELLKIYSDFECYTQTTSRIGISAEPKPRDSAIKNAAVL